MWHALVDFSGQNTFLYFKSVFVIGEVPIQTCISNIQFLFELGSSGSATTHLPGYLCPLTFSLNIGMNMLPSDYFMSCLDSLLWYSTGEFRALQLIVLVVFGVIARVTPVFKNNGDVDALSNHRPISVIGHMAKMVEQLVRSQLVNYLEEHSFITPDQSAYLKGHSTQTSLHRVIDDWLENINEDQITGVCLLDISKCFDTISYSILLQKLSMYWIKQQELLWFSSYLDRRNKLCFVTMSCHHLLM